MRETNRMMRQTMAFLVILLLILPVGRANAADNQRKSAVKRTTVTRLLKTAKKPVGKTMYIWGGGWNRADDGAGIEARSIGVSPRWVRFFNKQTADYDYDKTRYQIHDGLDCSGYVGWVIYNIRNTFSGNKGYVMSAKDMAQNFADRGWGTFTPKEKVKKHRAGDIMSSSGHVYIVVGECADGSVVLMHSSPPGVMITGTAAPDGTADSEAVRLANKYMKKYYPKWTKKFPDSSRGANYLTDFARMRWDVSGKGRAIMTDPDRLRNKSAKQVLKVLFNER